MNNLLNKAGAADVPSMENCLQSAYDFLKVCQVRQLFGRPLYTYCVLNFNLIA